MRGEMAHSPAPVVSFVPLASIWTQHRSELVLNRVQVGSARKRALKFLRAMATARAVDVSTLARQDAMSRWMVAASVAEELVANAFPATAPAGDDAASNDAGQASPSPRTGDSAAMDSQRSGQLAGVRSADDGDCSRPEDGAWPAAVVEARMDNILAKLGGLDFRMDRETGMYDAVALVRSRGACLNDFRRDRSKGQRKNQQTREELIRSVMRDENLPREKVWLVGTGGKPTQVCGAIAGALAVWVQPDLEAPILSLVTRLAEIRTGAHAHVEPEHAAPAATARASEETEPVPASTAEHADAEDAVANRAPSVGARLVGQVRMRSARTRFAGISPVPGLQSRPHRTEVRLARSLHWRARRLRRGQ